MFRWFFTGRSGLFAKRVLCENGEYQYRPIWSELTDELIKAHMHGHVMLGSYPILEDSTTHWAAADFDGHNGNAFEHAKVFVEALRAYEIEPICNVSQSGHGVHVRVVFADPRRMTRNGPAAGTALKPVHAAVARRFMMKVIEQTELPHLNDGGAFDRVFPVQDHLRNRASIGNQIALPLNKKAAVERGGSMLLDHNFERIPLQNSWDFMNEYRLVQIVDLLDAAMDMGEVHHIFECVDADNNFLEAARFDGVSRGSVFHQNKLSKNTREQLEYMVRACDFIQWTRATQGLPYVFWLALVSQLIMYDNVGGRAVFQVISSMDTSCDSRGRFRYSVERADRQYDQALATLRGPYSCKRIAAEGWRCQWLGEDGSCTKFHSSGGRGAFSPAKMPFYRARDTRRVDAPDHDCA